MERVHLRYHNSNDATVAASAIVGRYSIPEERLSPVEETLVEARFPFSVLDLVIHSYALVVRLIFGAVIIEVLALLGLFGLIAGVVLVVSYFGLAVWAMVRRRRVRVETWIRIEEGALKFRTSSHFSKLVPKVIGWKNAETFLVSGSRKKIEIHLPTHEDALRVASWIKASFPQAREEGLVS